MAIKVDKELIDDARKENRQNHGKNGTTNLNGQENNSPAPEREETAGQNSQTTNGQEKINNAKTENANSNSQENTQQNFYQEQQTDSSQGEFKAQFDEYFKGSESIIAGEAITGMIDDLKANFLLVYAKKQGVDMSKSAFLMDEKSKKFSSFLIDYAIKHKLVGIIEKYPLMAAGGVIALSGLTSYLFVTAMGNQKKETEDLKKKNADLEEKLKKWENAQTAEVINETKNADGHTNPDEVKDLIAKV